MSYKRPFYAWGKNRVLPQPAEGAREAPEMTLVEPFKRRGILKKTASPDLKLKRGRVLVWSEPLIHVGEYEISEGATISDGLEWQYDRKKTFWEKLQLFFCGTLDYC